MTSTQKKALKKRVRANVRFRRQELRKLLGVGSRFNIKSNRYFRVACSNIKKEIRLYNRLVSRIK